ncbi:hypothetical protein GTP91_24375 [Rugamonas sp. FT82W]|uniref:Restriction endonuclease type IV Mrr domain-containing protein n=1 Tax=Duganella vulcania TaxID=2692166 RepID=A0A845GA71_9BURK|nr:hypothetical protein [Duganella vulcania]MYM90295.1 hypothetical protein [Duganella vulcania]
MTISPISATEIRFIKLGQAGCWEAECIQSGTLQLGFESPYHEASLAGNWDVVFDFWKSQRTSERAAATAKDDVRQIRTFYEAPSTTLWITFFNRRLYWCFAEAEVIELEDKTRIRHAIGGWSCLDLKGRPLEIANIDGRVTTVQGYRGTICEINREMQLYTVNKINGIVGKDVANTISNLGLLRQSVRELVQGLHWKDFELLADLILTRTGWQRVSQLGGTVKDVDLELLAPVTGRRAYVQVKSQANMDTLMESISTFNGMAGYDDFFFLVHTASSVVQQFRSDDFRINVIGPDRISELVIDAGLTNWLIQRRS